MTYDPNGVVGRWSQAARRGTLANVVYALAVLTLVAVLANSAIG